MTTLLIFMVIDFVSGLVVAGVFHKSRKTESGKPRSKEGFKGLCKKCMILLFILIAYRLDLAIGSNYIKDAVCIAFMVNELISIAENAGLVEIPIPQFITGAIDALKNRKGDQK